MAIEPHPQPGLSVVTTTDPVAGHLPALLTQLSAQAEACGEQFEVIIVDDLKQWPSADAVSLPPLPGLTLRPLWYPEQRGQLAAMLAGLALANADAVLTTDPDMFACMDELPALRQRLQPGIQLVHGARTVRQDVSPLRRTGSLFANLAVQLITGLRVPDLHSPLTLLRPAAARDLLASVGQIGNPRLYLYASLGPALSVYPLRHSAPAGSPSQYRLFTLIALFFRLIRDSMEVRRKLGALPTDSR